MPYQIRRIPISAPPPRGGRTQRGGAWAAQSAQNVRNVLEGSGWGRSLLRIVHDLTMDVVPTPRLLRDEVIQVEIRQAWYRHVVPYNILRYWWLTLLASILISVLIGYVAYYFGGPWVMGLIGVALPAGLFVWATEETLRYKQWLLLVTNRRTILYMPTPRSRFLVDNVRLQAGKIQVVDVNFSRSRWWQLWQFLTGARDLVISISGYEFKENSAEVKGGLVMPDVMQDDITKLEEIVFPKK